MSDLIKHLKAEAARNQRLSDTKDLTRRRTNIFRAKHMQRAIAEIERLTADLSAARQSLVEMASQRNGAVVENEKLAHEIEALRAFGNKDCTAQAEDWLEANPVSTQRSDNNVE